MLNRHVSGSGRFVGFSTLALVLSLGAASPVWAAELTGADGQPGTAGDPSDTQPGGDGGHGESATLVGTNAVNTARGGNGGEGGIGAPPGDGGNGGNAEAEASETAQAYAGHGGLGGNDGSGTGVHGNGGIAGTATATIDYTGTSAKSVNAVAEGGFGGSASGQGNSGNGGTGGGASAEAAAEATDGVGNMFVTADAQGGDGGSGLNAGSGGAAIAAATGQSDFGGGLKVTVRQAGGSGGEGEANAFPFTAGSAGHGADSVIDTINGQKQIDGYSQGGTVNLQAESVAGHGGSGYANGDIDIISGEITSVVVSSPGEGGDAVSIINTTSSHAETLFSATAEATGGNGGRGQETVSGRAGGFAEATTQLSAVSGSSPNTDVDSIADAVGGHGGDNVIFDSTGGAAGFGGQADALAEAEAINGDATANASAEGGNGGRVDLGSSGSAGVGGDANAIARATSQTGRALATAASEGGQGGLNSSGGNALGGLATAEAFASTGGLSFSVFDSAPDGGTATAIADLSAPVGGAGTIPTTPGSDTIGQIIIDSTTDTTVSYVGTLTMGRTGGALIRAANADHTISATTGIVFSTDITVDVVGATDSLTLTKSPTLSSGIELTKSGAGSLRLDQDFDLDSNKLIVMMESGTFSSAEPQISVTGDLDIGSVLDLDLVGAFEPSIGDEFDILEYTGTLTGVFDAVQFPSVDGLSFGIEYNTGAITLDVVLEGDLNDDGFVGSTDLNLVLGNFNQNVDAGVLLQGDPSGDGFVGSADLNTVLGNWNAGTPPVAGAAVPEPATLALLGLGGLVIGRRRA